MSSRLPSSSSNKLAAEETLDTPSLTLPPIRWYSRLPFMLAVLAIISAITTYIFISQTDETLDIHSNIMSWLFAINGILLIGLSSTVGHRIWKMWSALRQGSVGSRIQTRVVTAFSLAVLLPTLMVSIFAALFFHQGITSWFDERVGIALDESIIVAEAYLDEHRETLRADILAMSNDLLREMETSTLSPAMFQKIINTQVLLRSLTEAVVFQKGHVVARSRLSFSYTFEQIPENLLARAHQGEIVMANEDDKIIALISIDPLSETYLMISRLVDPKVLQHLENAQSAAGDYRNLRQRISDLQFQFSIVFVLVTLVLLSAVIWYGMSFVSRLVVPLSRLIKATEHIRAGDYSIRINTQAADGELGTLIERFNRMAEQLESNRRELTFANRQIDERRRFAQAVLEGASAGVIAVNPQNVITLNNRSAARLLRMDETAQIQGQTITSILPEIQHLLSEAHSKPKKLHQKDVFCTRPDGTNLTLHVRITSEMHGETVEGYIVTFDDITLLVSAQRRAAWADVARRIAHEIKNPLTPIQLSTERLRKKFLPEDEESQTTFRRYIDTIARHTSDIGNMVDEFVSFARMPTPVFAHIDIRGIVDKAIFSAQTAYAHINYKLNQPNTPIMVNCDERQMGQVLGNLLKNAAEAFERSTKHTSPATVTVTLTPQDDHLELIIEDNGIGFPPDMMDKIMEPYVTTREKGTGLGLAIVKKTLEDHGGSITLSNREEGGAHIHITLPIILET
jgi:two-component system, NtrC family, nitrogen regulation sensor histidine kinase NtrY